MYVELTENLCEGLIPIRDLGDDYYELDERNYKLVGRGTGRSFRLGDEVVVRVARTDLQRRQLDFVLVSDKGNGLQREPQKPRKRDHKHSGSRRK